MSWGTSVTPADLASQIQIYLVSTNDDSDDNVYLSGIGDVDKEVLVVWIKLLVDYGFKVLKYAEGMAQMRGNKTIEIKDIKTVFKEMNNIEKILSLEEDDIE